MKMKDEYVESSQHLDHDGNDSTWTTDRDDSTWTTDRDDYLSV